MSHIHFGSTPSHRAGVGAAIRRVRGSLGSEWSINVSDDEQRIDAQHDAQQRRMCEQKRAVLGDRMHELERILSCPRRDEQREHRDHARGSAPGGGADDAGRCDEHAGLLDRQPAHWRRPAR
jgi:hypothetical protein